MFQRPIFFDADGDGAGGSGDGGQQNNDGSPEPLVYDAWVKEQPDEVKTMLTGWESGLKSALQNEREARKDLEKQVRDLAGKAEKGSEAQTQLTQLADKIAEADRKVAFFEEAHAAGVTNLKLAYTVAAQDEMFDKHGKVNFETMKAAYPELFGAAKKPADGKAGAGKTNNPPGGSMNDWIRRNAGRA